MTEEELKELNAAVLERVKQSREGTANTDENADEKYEEMWKAIEIFESVKTRTGAKITRGLFNSATYGGRALVLEAPAKTTRQIGFVPNIVTITMGGKSPLFRAIPTAFVYVYWAPMNDNYYVGKIINNVTHGGQMYECLVDAVERLAEIVGET